MIKRKQLWLAVVLAMLVQMFAPSANAVALGPYQEVPADRVVVDPENTKLVVRNGTTNEIINPVNGVYNDVPKNAKIEINYAFSLLDNNGKDPDDPGSGYEEFHYTSEQAITVNMPKGIDFSSAIDIGVPVKVKDTGEEMGKLALTGSAIVISFHGNDYVETHSEMGGSFNVSGTFDSSITGNPAPDPIIFYFNGTTITINVKPDPVLDLKIDTSKSGEYDSESNSIIWTVKVKPINGDGTGITVEDVYSSNQDYLPDSFAVDGVTTPAGLSIDIPGRKLTYTFQEDILQGVEKTITYRTSPAANAFSSETKNNETAVFTNTATVKQNSNLKGTAVATVSMDWIQKKGSVDPAKQTLIHWTIDVNNNTKNVDSSGQSAASVQKINNPVIVDTIPMGLELVEDSIKFDGSAITADSSTGGPAPGHYSCIENGDGTKTLTYRHNGALTGMKTLKYDTVVKDGDAVLNTNEKTYYENNVSITWDGSILYGVPSDSSRVGVGNSVISKAAGNSIAYKNGSADIITWTIYVNQNKIKITNPIVTDDLPAGLEFVSFDTSDKTNGSINGTLTHTTTGFTYEFRKAGDSDRKINGSYTITVKARVTDYNRFYKNDTVGFTNTAKLFSTDVKNGVQISGGATQQFSSEVIKKSIVTAYDYNTRRVKWQIAVNNNKIPLTAAKITDTIPVGMKFLSHTFKVSNESGMDTAAGNLDFINKGDGNITDSDSFAYTFGGNGDTGTYYITYETEMKENYLKNNQFSSPRDFINVSEITCGNYSGTLKATATEKIKNPVVGKAAQYVKGEDRISWVVPINIGKAEWPDGIQISDKLQNELELDVDSIQLYNMTLKNNGDIEKSGSGEPIPKSSYTVTYDNRLFTISIPGPVTGVYQLEFSTDVLSDTATISNSVTFQGASFTAGSTANSIYVNVNDASAAGHGKQGSITVIKTDAEDSLIKISGAKFQLYDINKLPLAGKEKTTDNEGKLVFDKLPLRTYYIKEVAAPGGYLLDNEFKRVRLTSSTQNDEITVKDKKAACEIEFQKQTAAGQPLGGAEFAIYTKGGSGELKKAVSANNGIVVFSGIETGAYEIKEIKAPEGYYATSDIIEVNVEAINGNTAVKASLSRNTIQNNPIPKVIFGSVIVTKTADDGRLLAGAHFTIYDVNETAVQFGVSGQDGKALFNNLVPGQYTIRETEAPEGYELNNTDFQVIVLGNDTKEVTVVNKLKKIPDPGTNTPGNGTNTPGNGTNTPGNGTNTPGNGTNTPGNGTNTPGNGTNTPGNGTNTPEPDTDTPDTSAPKINEKTASISISKIDGRSRPIEGAEFSVMDLKGNTIAVVVSDKNGKVVFGKLKAGSYQLQETRAPEGYAVVSEKLKITIKAGQSLEYDFRNILLEELDGNKVPLGWIDVDKPDMPDKKHNGTKLPQAGTFFDTNMLLIFGMGFVALGSVLLVSRRRNKRNEA